MRSLFLVLWLLLPLPIMAYHLGPGQQQIIMDQVGQLLQQAETDVEEEDWLAAVATYGGVLELLPSDYVAESRRIRLERAKAQMYVSQLPSAHADLKGLVDEMRDDPAHDGDVFREARGALANSQYYMTWLMRLEGQTRERWEPEIESARQILATLAEEAESSGDAGQASRNREDLNATIRLARLTLADLQGLPLPSQ